MKKGSVVALAMTWDGARVENPQLSVKARAFLGKASCPTQKQMAELLAGGAIKEIRACWMPRLSGGGETLALPFETAGGKRVGFRLVRKVALGDCLGAVYRR